MFGFIASLLDPTNSGVLKKGLDLIDNSYFTDQEKAKNRLKLVKSHTKFVETAVTNENQTRSLTRRFIALIVILAWVPFFITVCVLGIYSIVKNTGQLPQLLDFITTINTPTIMILAFYFGSQFANGFMKK